MSKKNKEQVDSLAVLMILILLPILVFVMFGPSFFHDRAEHKKQTNTIIGVYYLDKLQNACENVNVKFTISELKNMTELKAIKEIENCEQLEKSKDIEVAIKRVSERIGKPD